MGWGEQWRERKSDPGVPVYFMDWYEQLPFNYNLLFLSAVAVLLCYWWGMPGQWTLLDYMYIYWNLGLYLTLRKVSVFLLIMVLEDNQTLVDVWKWTRWGSFHLSPHMETHFLSILCDRHQEIQNTMEVWYLRRNSVSALQTSPIPFGPSVRRGNSYTFSSST